MKSEHVDKIKELVMLRDTILSDIDNANLALKNAEKELEELCIVITKEKIQQDKEKK